MAKLTHIGDDGEARTVDVSDKDITDRTATARGTVLMEPETLKLIIDGAVKKGDVISVALLAGIMAAKKTSDLNPLCHPLALNKVDVDLTCDPARNPGTLSISKRPAGSAGAPAALTVYDMCKAVDRGIRLTDIRLVHKAGGKSGDFTAGE